MSHRANVGSRKQPMLPDGRTNWSGPTVSSPATVVVVEAAVLEVVIVVVLVVAGGAETDPVFAGPSDAPAHPAAHATSTSATAMLRDTPGRYSSVPAQTSATGRAGAARSVRCAKVGGSTSVVSSST